MGAIETVLLTGGIVVIDLIILNEYLKLEEQLRKIKEGAPASQEEALATIAQEVVEPLPEAIPAPVLSVELKSEAERENEKLKASNQALLESKKNIYTKQLDDIAEKIEIIATDVSSAKEKAVQYS